MNPGFITFRDVAIIHKLWELFYGQHQPKHERTNMTLSQELAGILTAAQALQAEIANPTISVLTTADQAQVDQIASTLGAPTSMSAASTPTPVASTPAPTASPVTSPFAN